ncbi:MAG: 4Fe-4S binding protein [Ignavibacteriaceae bacterium]
MSFVITTDCIYCGACIIECPQEAICKRTNKKKYLGKAKNIAYDNLIYINYTKCDECVSFESPKCISICPMDAIKSINREFA